MIQEAQNFLDESEALQALLAPLTEIRLDTATAFKGWPISRIVRHLHVWNIGAALSLSDPGRFEEWFARTAGHLEDRTLYLFEEQVVGPLTGRRLISDWQQQCEATARLYAAADPKTRIAWAGQSMSARSSITARLMETWAHGQAIYDLMGQVRADTDRIRGIAVLGFNTYEWSFKSRGVTPPAPRPFVCLTAPSGALWTFGEESANERIEGPATEFCQVVTQTRNFADTALYVTGPNASAWMEIAQCFAGPPEVPPARGQRRTLRTVRD